MKAIQKHIIYALVIVLNIAFINLLGYYFNHSALPGFTESFYFLAWTVYFTFGLYLVNAPFTVWVQNAFPSFDLKTIFIRFLVGTIGSGILTLFAGSFLYLLMLLMNGNSWEDSTTWLLSGESNQLIQMLIWVALTIAVVFQVIFFYQSYQASKLKEQKQKVVQISTQHESLKSQISSHFLFNSLNVLNGLIDENPEKAQDFVGELSSVYRYVLEQKDKTLVPLKEEIEFSKTYLKLIQMRFEDGIEFEIEESFSEDELIVPLSLQILLENCIKHNRISAEEPLRIKVFIKEGYLWIQNNLQLKKQMNYSTGKGLNSIISQYSNRSNKEVGISQTEEEFTVKLPLLTEKNIQMEINHKYTEEEYSLAKKRVEDVQGFYWNLTAYIIVNSFLTFLDLKDNGNYDWAYWPLIGWGIGITFHFVEVFGVFNSTSWKDKMIQKELDKRKRNFNRFND